METGWAALHVPAEEEKRRGNVAPLTAGRGEGKAVLVGKWGRYCSPQHPPFPAEAGCGARKLHSSRFVVVFSEGREHLWAPAYTPATVSVPCGSRGLRASSKSCLCEINEHAATARGEADSSWSGMPGQWSYNLLFFTQQIPCEEITWIELGSKSVFTNTQACKPKGCFSVMVWQQVSETRSVSSTELFPS